MDCISGEAALIGHEKFIALILNLRKISNYEDQNNWLIGLKLDHYYEVKVVNKKHPKHKQITTLIGLSLEHGIVWRTEYLHDHGAIILSFFIERLTNSQIFSQMKYELSKKRDKITLDQLSNLFILCLALFPCLFLVFIIECIYYKFQNNFLGFKM